MAGVVRITVPRLPGNEALLADLLARCADYPDWVIDWRVDEARLNAVENCIDMGVRLGLEPQPLMIVRRIAARHARAPVCAATRVLLRHLWRGRLHARRHAGGGARNPGRRYARRAAPVVHRANARIHPPPAGRLPRGRRQAHRRPARRSAQRLRAGRPLSVRQRSGRLHPRRNRQPLSHRRALKAAGLRPCRNNGLQIIRARPKDKDK